MFKPPFHSGSSKCAVAALVFALGASLAAGQEPKTEYAKEYYQAFKGAPANPQDFKAFGPDNEQCVKFEPEGLRITLPAGNPGTRPSTGVATGFGVRGDFEITIGFEMLQEPDKKDAGPQTRFTLGVNLDKPKPYENQATLSRRVLVGQAPDYITYLTLWEKDATKQTRKSNAFPAAEKTGRFRLVRAGANISYLVSEGKDPEFKQLKTYAFGAEDVRDITIVGSTGSENAALDVRVLDLRVKAAALPKPGPIKVADIPAPPKKNYAQDYFQSFKDSKTKRPGWDFEGPEAEQCVRFEPAGMRITLAAGWDGSRPGTGVKSEFPVKGDFEITVDFEVLQEPQTSHVGNVGTRLSVAIYKDTPKSSVATISRAMSAKQESVFVTWQHVWNDAIDKHDPQRAHAYDTKAKKGRLRLVRAGADLYFGVAESHDGDFHFKSKYPFGAEDLRDVRILGSTGNEKCALDVRVTNLRIRADAIPNKPAGTSPTGAQEDPPPVKRPWLMAALIIGGVMVVLIAVGLGAGYFLLRRRDVPKAAVKSVPKGKR